MTKHKITQEDWIKIGTSLKKVREELLDVSIIADDILGVTNKGAKEIDKAIELLDRARCELENQMFWENPYLSNYWLNCFYGPEMDFDPDSEEAKLYKPDPLGLKGRLKEEKK